MSTFQTARTTSLPESDLEKFEICIIAGLGREGFSSFTYLRKMVPNARFILADDLKEAELDAQWKAALEESSVSFVPLAQLVDIPLAQMATAPLEQVAEVALVDVALAQEADTTLAPFTDETSAGLVLLCKTPGISTENPAVSSCLQKGCQLTSNTNLFLAAIQKIQDCTTIGVTGTKGKSTTSSLLAHVLAAGEQPVYLVGNIGKPPLDVVEDVVRAGAAGAHPYIVMELSSHQLRETQYSPNIAVLLNITPEHLDYYPTFASYWQAKAGIVRYQTTNDIVMYHPNQAIPANIAASSPAKKVFLNQSVDSPQATEEVPAVWYDQTSFYVGSEPVASRMSLPLRGEHNCFNALPAIWMGKYIGLENQQIQAALQSFEALPHRLEPAGEVAGVMYVNDSQATTPEATIAALSSFPGKAITLLAGGSDKGVSFESLAAAILQADIKHLILFPPMGELIWQAVQRYYQQAVKSSHQQAVQSNHQQAVQSFHSEHNLMLHSSGSTPSANSSIHSINSGKPSKTAPVETSTPSEIEDGDHVLPKPHFVTSMPEAVAVASKVTPPGGVVLLSPACASFGLFKNYQDRGNQFKAAVGYGLGL